MTNFCKAFLDLITHECIAVKAKIWKPCLLFIPHLLLMGWCYLGGKNLRVKQSKERNLDRHQKMNSISENFFFFLVGFLLLFFFRVPGWNLGPHPCRLVICHVATSWALLIVTVVNNENKTIYRGISAVRHIPFSQLWMSDKAPQRCYFRSNTLNWICCF